MLLRIVPIVVGALWMLGGIVVERWITNTQKGGTRQRAGFVALIVVILCFVALVVMQLVYPANWPFGVVVAVVAVPLALVVRARWARRRSRSGRSA